MSGASQPVENLVSFVRPVEGGGDNRALQSFDRLRTCFDGTNEPGGLAERGAGESNSPAEYGKSRLKPTPFAVHFSGLGTPLSQGIPFPGDATAVHRPSAPGTACAAARGVAPGSDMAAPLGLLSSSIRLCRGAALKGRQEISPGQRPGRRLSPIGSRHWL